MLRSSPIFSNAQMLAVVLVICTRAALISCFGVSCFGAYSARAAERPNIVLIMCDDMGWSDLGCYGSEIQTPHLDHLASQGLRFTQFYNNAKCTTTRASILTGLYPRQQQGDLLQTNMVTLGEVMRTEGYHTALIGKWHLGDSPTTHPYHRGFEEFYGLLDGCCNYFNPTTPDPPFKGGRVRSFARNLQAITEFPSDFYTTDAFTDEAIKAVERFKESKRPFFLHLCYTAPHYPLHAKPEDIKKYVGKFRQGWNEMRRRRYARQQKMGLIDARWQLTGDDSHAYDWKTSDQEFEDLRMAVYAAMIDAMDQNIGRLIAALQELKMADNTLVLFLSDNGGCATEPGGRDPTVRHPGPKDDYVSVGPGWGWAQNSPFRRYKSWTHEGGVCTPLIAFWPGHIKPGTITQQPAHIIDFMPTCLELAEGKYPSEHAGQEILPLEGKSLLPIFAGKQRIPHQQLAWEWAGNAAIRQGDWKAIWDKRVKQWELYDLATDRTENTDLAARHPKRLDALVKAYDIWAQQTGNQRVKTH